MFVKYQLVEGVSFHPKVDRDTFEQWLIAADVVRQREGFDVTFHLRKAKLQGGTFDIEEIRAGRGGWRSEHAWLDLTKAHTAQVTEHDERRLSAMKANLVALEYSFCNDVSMLGASQWLAFATDDYTTLACPRCASLVNGIPAMGGNKARSRLAR